MQGHLPHLGKLLGGLGLPESGGTVAVRFSPVKGFLPYRADKLRPVVALIAGDVLAFETEIDELLHGLALDENTVQVLEAVLILGFKVTAIGGLTALENTESAGLELSAKVKSLALGKAGLAVVFHPLIEGLFYHLAVFQHIRFDLPVFRVFLLDPLDGVVQQIRGKWDDVIAWP